MNGRKALTGISVLCALALCAFAAPTAFAATSGTTAVTCVPVATGGTNDYGDAHCDNTKASGGFGHAALGSQPTAVVGTNAKTKNETKEAETAVLTTTAGGLETEIKCTGVSSTGNVANELSGEVHRIIGSVIFVIYTGCTVPKPAGQECKIPGGKIETKSLKSESIEEGETMKQKFLPTSGEEFVSVVFEGCKTAGLNKAYPVLGTVNADPSGTDNPKSSGATALFRLVKNALSTLTFGGQKAGLTQTETISMSGGGFPIVTTAPPYTVK